MKKCSVSWSSLVLNLRRKVKNGKNSQNTYALDFISTDHRSRDFSPRLPLTG